MRGAVYVRLAAALVFASALPVLANAAIESRTVQFAKGASSATLKGSLKGDQTIDYKLRAKAGQSMRVSLQTSNGANYFNVLPPGSNDVAIFVGSTDGNQWTGTLPADGEYKIRVYLMRSAARRGETANYTLTVGVDGAANAAPQGGGAQGLQAAMDRAIEGRFDATGKIPCAQNAGQPMGQCDFGVARAGGGSAALAVTRPDGRKRLLYFERGRATGADASQADGAFRASKDADLFRIQVGNERYEVPEAAISGG